MAATTGQAWLDAFSSDAGKRSPSYGVIEPQDLQLAKNAAFRFRGTRKREP